MYGTHKSNQSKEIISKIAQVKAAFEDAAASPSADERIDLHGRAWAYLDDLVQECERSDEGPFNLTREKWVTADCYVKQNPWRSTMIGTSVGLLAGVAILRS